MRGSGPEKPAPSFFRRRLDTQIQGEFSAGTYLIVEYNFILFCLQILC